MINNTATTQPYTLPLHDALPIFPVRQNSYERQSRRRRKAMQHEPRQFLKSLLDAAIAAADPAKCVPPHLRSEEHTSNSSHGYISYAVFCLKKKKNKY